MLKILKDIFESEFACPISGNVCILDEFKNVKN